ncbi:MAG: hypothetical protein ACRYG8_23735 [Janthinobacterium lividum]
MTDIEAAAALLREKGWVVLDPEMQDLALKNRNVAVAEYREGHEQQPETDTQSLASAIAEFEVALPGWWWSVCVCSLTRDASCGPDMAGPDHELSREHEFDDGFHCDDAEGTLASSLRDVMQQALDAKRAALARKD